MRPACRLLPRTDPPPPSETPPSCPKPLPRADAKPPGTSGREGRSSRSEDPRTALPPTPDPDPTPWTVNEGGKRLLAASRGSAALPGQTAAGKQGAGGGWGVRGGSPGGLTSCSIARSLPRSAGKHGACSIQNAFEKDGLEAVTNTPLYSLLIQRPAARSELHGQAFSPALFYKVGRAGLDAGGGGGEREKKRDRGKEGTPAGWAEGEAEAEANLGSGAAAPARACGRARVTPRARAPRVPRRPAAAAAAAAVRSAPGSALARPRRGAARGRSVQPDRPCAPASLCASLAQPLFACLCASPPAKPSVPRGRGGGTVSVRPPRVFLPASLLSPLAGSCRNCLPCLLSLPCFTAWARLSAPLLSQPSPVSPEPGAPFPSPRQPASLPRGTALGLTCCLSSSRPSTGPATALRLHSHCLAHWASTHLLPGRGTEWGPSSGARVPNACLWAPQGCTEKCPHWLPGTPGVGAVIRVLASSSLCLGKRH